jgi:hypothetical protein
MPLLSSLDKTSPPWNKFGLGYPVSVKLEEMHTWPFQGNTRIPVYPHLAYCKEKQWPHPQSNTTHLGSHNSFPVKRCSKERNKRGFAESGINAPENRLDLDHLLSTSSARTMSPPQQFESIITMDGIVPKFRCYSRQRDYGC